MTTYAGCRGAGCVRGQMAGFAASSAARRRASHARPDVKSMSRTVDSTCRMQEELDAVRGSRPASPLSGAARRQSSLAEPQPHSRASFAPSSLSELHGRPSFAPSGMGGDMHGRPSFAPSPMGEAGTGIASNNCRAPQNDLSTWYHRVDTAPPCANGHRADISPSAFPPPSAPMSSAVQLQCQWSNGWLRCAGLMSMRRQASSMQRRSDFEC